MVFADGDEGAGRGENNSGVARIIRSAGARSLVEIIPGEVFGETPIVFGVASAWSMNDWILDRMSLLDRPEGVGNRDGERGLGHGCALTGFCAQKSRQLILRIFARRQGSALPLQARPRVLPRSPLPAK